MLPLYLEPNGPLIFPDARGADAEGLVAVGGDLSRERLLLAYRSGVFPWYDEGVPPLWWSPDPRAVLPLSELRVPRRLERTIRAGGFALTWDRSFREVMSACAEGRGDGTWIIPEMVTAYVDLHRQGYAHSVEMRADGELVGGLYGVQVGAVFAAESMFHRRRDASKISLVAAVRSLCAAGIEVFDVQILTPHLESMGAVEWPRGEYLRRIEAARDLHVDLTHVELNAS